MAEEDFLTLENTYERVQKNAQNICQSYSHPWDVLAELAQNSVDAIRQWEREFPNIDRDHKITITIDQRTRKVIVKDSGIGISPERVKDLLAPNGTDKSGDILTIGEKGVGLTFCIFSCNRFKITTRSQDGEYSGKIQNAQAWRDAEEAEAPPKIEVLDKSESNFDPEETGTRVVLEQVEQPSSGGLDIFEISEKRLEYVLRTKTALGNTKKKYDEEDIDLDIDFKFISNEEENSRNIPFEYYYPDNFVPDKEIVDIEEDFGSVSDALSLSPQQKEDRLGGKYWKIEGTENWKGKDIRYYAIFVPHRSAWEKMSERNGLISKTGKEHDVKSGIYIATRGMPTGISIDQQERASQGMYPQVFMLLGYDGFQFDLGRKSVPGPTSVMLQKVAHNIFKRFQRLYRATSQGAKSGAVKDDFGRWVRKTKFEDLKKEAELDISGTNFLRAPDSEEAVSAVFHELVGSGVFDRYSGIASGHKVEHDLWATYEAQANDLDQDIGEGREILEKDVVLKFVVDAEEILSYVEDDRKFFKNLDILVCWNFNADTFEENSIAVSPVEESVFQGVKYSLSWPTSADLGDSKKKRLIVLSELD